MLIANRHPNNEALEMFPLLCYCFLNGCSVSEVNRKPMTGWLGVN